MTGELSMVYFALYGCPNLRHKFQRSERWLHRTIQSRQVGITVGQTLEDEEGRKGE